MQIDYVYSKFPFGVFEEPNEKSNPAYVVDAYEPLKIGQVISGSQRESGDSSWLWCANGLGFVNPSRVNSYPPDTIRGAVYVNKKLTPDDGFITSVQWMHPEKAIHFVRSRNVSLIRRVVFHYWYHCMKVNLNPVVVLAQAILETDYFTSEWFLLHNNPAGIGVTGVPDQGLSFSTLEDGIKSHIGRLLAYILLPTEANSLQKTYIDKALLDRALPDSYRGIAKSINGLNMTWAMVDYYADSICNIANRCLGI